MMIKSRRTGAAGREHVETNSRTTKSSERLYKWTPRHQVVWVSMFKTGRNRLIAAWKSAWMSSRKKLPSYWKQHFIWESRDENVMGGSINSDDRMKLKLTAAKMFIDRCRNCKSTFYVRKVEDESCRAGGQIKMLMYGPPPAPSRQTADPCRSPSSDLRAPFPSSDDVS